MKIGIIVYSQTGNTYSVSSKLYEQLKKEGCNVKLERVEATRDMKKNPNVFSITKSPQVNDYDVIVLASYVEAFMLNPVMKKYLDALSTLQGKRVLCLVTQHFPYPWMGGNNAIRKMTAICKEKGAIIEKTGVINWTNKKREAKIESLINDFIRL